tara:strand:+ start:47 stop:391 length:345 start_codon:yes stop_codon:yes gene_type:complete
MREYEPDAWVIAKIQSKEKTFYSVLSGWNGGYLSGDVWRLSSSITGIEKQGYLYGFYCRNGSVYWCHSGSYKFTSYTSSVYDKLKSRFNDEIEIMKETTNWVELVAEIRPYEFK